MLHSVFLTLAVSLLSPVQTFAQQPQLTSVISPSPRSQEFEKFINYKVSLYNGLPEININFHTISLDGVKIPIGISYHASGIKFGQTSGDVGLGWNFNPGYRISRTMYGRLDEASTMPDMNNFPGGQTIQAYLSGFTSKYDRDRYLARYFVMNPNGDLPAVTAISSEDLDGQYDQFTIGLPEQSGNFIISNRQNGTVSMLDNSNLSKINYTLTGGIITGFNVTDWNGVLYKLGENDQNNESLQVYVNGVLKKYSTAWHVSEITTPFANKINFQYQAVEESSFSTPGYSRTILEGHSEAGICTQGPSMISCFRSSDNKGVSRPGSSNVYNSKILSSITSPDEQVVIARNTDGTVSTISISRKSGVLLKKVSFFYSRPAERIFLDSIHVAGTDLQPVERYHFNYTSKDIYFRNYDCFGYIINDPGGDYRFANEYGRFDYQRVGSNPYDNIIVPPGTHPNVFCSSPVLDFVNLAGLNKRSIPASNVGMLERITYPTGGSQRFFYESNQYEAVINGFAQNVYGGGFRISSISSNDAVRGTTLTRNYLYGKGNRQFDLTDPKYFLREKVSLGLFFCASTEKIVSLRKTTLSSSLSEELSAATSQANAGWYNEVTEDYGTGKIIYKFGITDPTEAETMIPNQSYLHGGATVSRRFPEYYIASYKFWNKPFLTEKTTYAMVNGNPSPRQKETFEYYFPSPSPGADIFTGLKVSAFALGDNSVTTNATTPPYDLYTNSGIQSAYNYSTYTIVRGDILPRKKEVTEYDAQTGAELKVVTEYDYTAGNLLKSEKVTTSKGDVLLSGYKYPSNYTGITGTDNISAGIKNLQTVNLLTPVVEKCIYRTNADGTNKRLLSAQFTAFKPTMPVPDKIFTMEMTVPVTSFPESGVTGGAVTKNNSYQEQISLETYNAKGSIQQQARTNNVKETYVWGYNGRFPLAKVTGSDLPAVQQLINQTMLDNASTYTDAQIRTELNKLRTGLPQAFVNTYTVLPLTGVTSETNPAGQTTYYEYDNFNRLRLIRDQDNKILKQFDYQHRAQLSPWFVNAIRSQVFTRNNCGTAHGTDVTYTVPDGRYISTISQADADLQAQNDINANGQAYANTYGYCIIEYSSALRSGVFTRNNCTSGATGENVSYVVPAGTYTSTISQADADRKADDDIALNGQQYANTNGTCFPPVYAKVTLENVVPTPTMVTGNVVVRFYSDSPCTIPYSVPNTLSVKLKTVRTSTIDFNNTETDEWFNCTGSSKVLKSGVVQYESTSSTPGSPYTSYTFTLQAGFGYIVR